MSEKDINTAKPVTVECGLDFQGITIWCGDGAPITVDDRHTGADLRDWITAPLQRAITVARLRAIADMLDTPDILDGLRPVAIKGISPDQVLTINNG